MVPSLMREIVWSIYHVTLRASQCAGTQKAAEASALHCAIAAGDVAGKDNETILMEVAQLAIRQRDSRVST